MNRYICFATLFAFLLAFAVSRPAKAEDYGQTKVNPASLAERELAAESRGDVAAALALYSDDATVQNGGLCLTPCVGKAAIQKELERRAAARNHAKVVGKYVSGNVAILKTEIRLTFSDTSGVDRPVVWSPGVDRLIVWHIYEVTEDKIAVVTFVGQQTDPQTAQFIKWLQSQPK
jgi:hypothetical protein